MLGLIEWAMRGSRDALLDCTYALAAMGSPHSTTMAHNMASQYTALSVMTRMMLSELETICQNRLRFCWKRWINNDVPYQKCAKDLTWPRIDCTK